MFWVGHRDKENKISEVKTLRKPQSHIKYTNFLQLETCKWDDPVYFFRA